ncbi:MAG: MFS transporter [Rhodothermales bacterium]|nr:MFS transporter [Rhodothermales bacterium]
MLTHLRRFSREPAFIRIGVVFAIHAILFAFWVTRIPEIKAALNLSEGALGVALFFLPLGALVAMLSVSWLTHRFGVGAVTIWTTTAMIISMILPFLAPNAVTLGAYLFVVGVTGGAMDISMNALVATLERSHQTVIMSTCHGFFSLGGMIGALLGSALIAAEVAALPQMAAGIALMLFVTHRWLRPMLSPIRETAGEGGAAFALPGRALLALSVIAFCSMQGEGIIADWSAVFLEDLPDSRPFMWGLGYAGFSLTMTLGRFSGDQLIQQRGARAVLLGAFGIVTAGLALTISGNAWMGIAGFTVAGLGYALLVPIVFSEAAKKPGVRPSQGIAGVATVGYTGFLLGPVVMGGIAHVASLTVGFGYLIGLSALGWLVAARAVKRP